VVTLGDPVLRPLGFEPARFDLRCRWPDTAEAFQVPRLADDALNGVHGLVEYSDHFNRFKALQQRLKRAVSGNEALFLALR
jgi:putative acetyltransferase